MSFIVGLTGGIGSGKSAVGSEFERLGITVIDYDSIAHQLTAPGGDAIPHISQTFGAEFITPEGAMDRKRMRTLAFGDPEAKRRLEKILHPMIRAESARRADAAAGPYVILMNPLLVETLNDDRRFNRIVIVDCPEELQVKRVVARSSLAEDEVRRIVAAQMSRWATRACHGYRREHRDNCRHHPQGGGTSREIPGSGQGSPKHACRRGGRQRRPYWERISPSPR